MQSFDLPMSVFCQKLQLCVVVFLDTSFGHMPHKRQAQRMWSTIFLLPGHTALGNREHRFYNF